MKPSVYLDAAKVLDSAKGDYPEGFVFMDIDGELWRITKEGRTKISDLDVRRQDG